MPLEEQDMDKVFDLRCKYFLKEMETGKFYSYDELSKLILACSLHKPQLNVAGVSKYSFRYGLC